MAIVNRDLDSSEQLYTMEHTVGALGTGVSAWIGLVPAPGQVLQVALSGRGLSAVPVYTLAVARWTSAGITNISLGQAVTLASAFGLSGGVVGATYAASSSLAAVQTGDLLVLNTSGANTAVTDLSVAVVIKATQDIKRTFSIS
jgi:hypothetical protein